MCEFCICYGLDFRTDLDHPSDQLTKVVKDVLDFLGGREKHEHTVNLVAYMVAYTDSATPQISSNKKHTALEYSI